MSHKRLIIFLIGLVALFFLGIYAMALLSHQGETLAIVEKDGKEIAHFDLQTITDTTTYTIGTQGAQNTIEVSPEGIAVVAADCPDQTCVKQGIRSHGPIPIICLPHQLTIRFVDETDGELDATTGQ